MSGTPLSQEDLRKTHGYWRACNYLALGIIYLIDNPLLKEPLTPAHVNNRLLGHGVFSPGVPFIYVHLNRLIKQHDLCMIFMAGPGHGSPETSIHPPLSRETNIGHAIELPQIHIQQQ